MCLASPELLTGLTRDPLACVSEYSVEYLLTLRPDPSLGQVIVDLRHDARTASRGSGSASSQVPRGLGPLGPGIAQIKAYFVPWARRDGCPFDEQMSNTPSGKVQR